MTLGTALAALCLVAGPAHDRMQVRIPVERFTLRWTHSIEKTRWEEDWHVAGDWLVVTGARIRGTGAGMEPPEGAWREGGVYHYRVADPWRREMQLARSEFVPDYRLCIDGNCRPMSDWIPVAAGTTTLRTCASESTPARG